jgi:hypothetical protein
MRLSGRKKRSAKNRSTNHLISGRSVGDIERSDSNGDRMRFRLTPGLEDICPPHQIFRRRPRIRHRRAAGDVRQPLRCLFGKTGRVGGAENDSDLGLQLPFIAWGLADDVAGTGRCEAVTAKRRLRVRSTPGGAGGGAPDHSCGDCCRFAPKGSAIPNLFRNRTFASTGVGDVAMRAFGGYVLLFGLLASSLVVLGWLVLLGLRWL